MVLHRKCTIFSLIDLDLDEQDIVDVDSDSDCDSELFLRAFSVAYIAYFVIAYILYHFENPGDPQDGVFRPSWGMENPTGYEFFM